jgi:hypothetical protein
VHFPFGQSFFEASPPESAPKNPVRKNVPLAQNDPEQGRIESHRDTDLSQDGYAALTGKLK